MTKYFIVHISAVGGKGHWTRISHVNPFLYVQKLNDTGRWSQKLVCVGYQEVTQEWSEFNGDENAYYYEYE